MDKQHISKINLIQDYIEKNLNHSLTLEELSQKASYSPYYFHRLFKDYTKESLYGYIKRIRLEKAAFFLLTDKKKSISEIAIRVGFANQASFAKAFHQYFGMNASEYRLQEQECLSNSKNGQMKGNDGKVSSSKDVYNKIDTNKEILDAHQTTKRIKPNHIVVKNIVRKDVIYVRYTGQYKQDAKLFSQLFQRLYQWAFARDLIHSDTQWLVLYHDVGNLTEDDKLRLSVCMTIDTPVRLDDEIGTTKITAGKYAIGSFLLDSTQYQQAWDYMVHKWLPESGFHLSDKPAFEFYPPDEEGQENDCENSRKRLVDIYLPVVPK